MFEVQSTFIACDRIGIRDARKGSIVNPCPSDSGFAVPSCSVYSLGCCRIKVQKGNTTTAVSTDKASQ